MAAAGQSEGCWKAGMGEACIAPASVRSLFWTITGIQIPGLLIQLFAKRKFTQTNTHDLQLVLEPPPKVL